MKQGSMLIFLNKADTDKVAQECTPISNTFVGTRSLKSMFKIVTWYYTYGVDCNSPLKLQDYVLSELLGSKPFHLNGSEGRASYWGFSFRKSNDYGFDKSPKNFGIVYHDRRGLKIEVHKLFKTKDLQPLINQLVKIFDQDKEIRTTGKGKCTTCKKTGTPSGMLGWIQCKKCGTVTRVGITVYKHKRRVS